MLDRGIDPASLDDILHLISPDEVVTSPDQMLDDAFRPREEFDTPFPKTRFSDGTIGVYYSALEERTCKAELSFRIRSSAPEDSPRYYSLVGCHYDGHTADIRELGTTHSELTSKDETGYPFCRELAKSAVAEGLDGFLTTSARADGGTCVPVFTRRTLSNPAVECVYRTSNRGGRVEFHKQS